MSRRDISKREKIRAEEIEIDKQLKDAGFDMLDIALDEKKAILQMLEESRQCALQEADQRQQILDEEDKVLNETLDKSSNLRSEVKELENPKSSSDVTISSLVTDAEQVCEAECAARSGSVTPDILPSSSEILAEAAPSYSPSLDDVTKSNSSTPTKHSGTDSLLFSQSSAKLGVDENVIRECIETIRVSESDEDEDNESLGMSCSPSVSLGSPSKKRLQNVTSSAEKKPACSPRGKTRIVQPRVPLRKYQSVEVSTPGSITQSTERKEVKSSSQGFSFDRRFIDRLDEGSLISPVIGQRRLISSIEKKTLTPKESIASIQDAEISNSLCVKPIHTISAAVLSDEDSNGTGIHSSSGSQSQTLSKKDEDEVLSSSEPKYLKSDVIERKEVMKRKRDSLDDITSEKRECQELSEITTGRVTMRKTLRDTKALAFANFSVSDSDEDIFIHDKREGKKNINVFFAVENEISFKRKLEKSEDPKKAYFKKANESVKAGYERILSCINQSLADLELYQSSLIHRLPWPSPIGIDKRVKDSLDRPRGTSRRQIELPHTTSDIEPSRMITRNTQQKTSVYSEEEACLSEESLPDVASNNGGWLDARKKTTHKRRGLQLGLSRKQARFTSDEVDQRLKATTSSKNVISESESEDFEPSASLVTRLSPITKSKALSNGQNSKVSSLSKIDEDDRTNFELGNILMDSQQDESSIGKGNIDTPPLQKRNEADRISKVQNDSQPNTSGGVTYSRKRPRKTFRLSAGSDEDSKRNSEESNTLVSKSEVSHSVVPVTARSPKDIAKENSSPKCDSKYFESRKEPLLFIDSSEEELKDILQIKQNVNDDPCVVNDFDNIPSTSKPISHISRRGRGAPLQLKPAPLRFKNKRGRGRGPVSGRDQNSEDFAVQPQSTSEQQHQQQVVHSESRGAEKSVEETMECPLCQQPFALSVIEAHASTCGEPAPEMPSQQPTLNSSKGKRRLLRGNEELPELVDTSDEDVNKIPKIRARNDNRERMPTYEKCMMCKDSFKEGDEYLLHVRDCETRMKASPSMALINAKTPGRKERSPNPNGASSNLVRLSKAPATQLNSVFDRLEGIPSIQVHCGDITELEFRKPSTALVHIVNCVAVRPHGLSQILADKYPYCNIYASRQPIDRLNRARGRDRAVPGTIKICKPPMDSKKPIVVSVFGQFYMGKAYHKNPMSKKLVSQMEQYRLNGDLAGCKSPQGNSRDEDNKYFDPHLLNNLKLDTSENRIRWFKEALEHLEQTITKENIKRIVFPFGIGCGLAGGNWDSDYFPAVKSFNARVAVEGIEVILVKKVEKTVSDQDMALAGTMRNASISQRN